jgi:small-conductance mechanosensitive channel
VEVLVSEMNVSPVEIASVDINVGGQKQRLIVTKDYVKLHARKWILREDTSFIPLNSIDSIFFGWKRHVVLLILGVVFVLGGIGARQVSAGLLLGAIFLIIFWFYRPSVVLVRSAKEVLGGKPYSAEDAGKFISTLSEILNKK